MVKILPLICAKKLLYLIDKKKMLWIEAAINQTMHKMKKYTELPLLNGKGLAHVPCAQTF